MGIDAFEVGRTSPLCRHANEEDQHGEHEEARQVNG